MREKQRRTPHKSKESFEEDVTFKRTYHYEYIKKICIFLEHYILRMHTFLVVLKDTIFFKDVMQLLHGDTTVPSALS